LERLWLVAWGFAGSGEFATHRKPMGCTVAQSELTVGSKIVGLQAVYRNRFPKEMLAADSTFGPNQIT
jgi:hypothetical protein